MSVTSNNKYKPQNIRYMSKEMMEAMYISYDEKYGVLSANERRVITHILGTDLTLVYDKAEGITYLLVPLTKRHTFECFDTWIVVDGKRIESDWYFPKDGCEWIKIDNETLSKVA